MVFHTRGRNSLYCAKKNDKSPLNYIYFWLRKTFEPQRNIEFCRTRLISGSGEAPKLHVTRISGATLVTQIIQAAPAVARHAENCSPIHAVPAGKRSEISGERASGPVPVRLISEEIMFGHDSSLRPQPHFRLAFSPSTAIKSIKFIRNICVSRPERKKRKRPKSNIAKPRKYLLNLNNLHSLLSGKKNHS